jgi:hypothetical protein
MFCKEGVRLSILQTSFQQSLVPTGHVVSSENIHKVSANHNKELQIVAMFFSQIKTKRNM